jgi:4-hydroxy-tetrahydrodipicolinate synthase
MLGTDVGPVRLPGVESLTDAERAELRAIVDNVSGKNRAA